MRKKTIIGTVIIVLLCGGLYIKSTLSNKSVATTAVTQTTDSSVDFSINQYMKKNNVTLKAKDIQFDMKNNLDKDFAIEGIATLAEYYNFGFTDETNNFCIKIGTDNTEVDSWYLYCNRIDYAELFNLLNERKNVSITAKCKITTNKYQDGQGNLAQISNIEWME